MLMLLRTAFLLFSIVAITFSVRAEILTDSARPPHYQAPVTNTPCQLDVDQTWALNSTLISPQRKLAVINGKMLAIGEEISGATVTAIDHQSIELTIDDAKTVLTLQNSFIEHIN